MGPTLHTLCALSLALAAGCAVEGESVGSIPLAPEIATPSGTVELNGSVVERTPSIEERTPESDRPFVLDLVAGASHACVRTVEGYVRCWGSNDYGQLGRAPSAAELLPAVAGHGALAQHVFAGPTQTAVLDKSQQFGHWGLFAPRNDDGVTPWSRHDTPGVAPLAGVAFGERFALAWDDEGHLVGWGAPDGANFSTAFVLKPVVIHLGVPVAQVALWTRDGRGHGCLVVPVGFVGCWGDNDRGQLSASPVEYGILRVPTVSRVVSMSLGDRYSCALRGDATAWCWGANDVGQLGDGTARDRGIPARVAITSQVLALSTGARHACALTRDGSVWCWGANDRGQLGASSVELFSTTPLRVAGLPKSTSVAVGDDFSCARTEDGRAWCWGNNDRGQLGDGTTVMRAEPRPIRL
ncbi:MAG: hypothetical protein U0326_07745 [Polyangiales bacterium]